MNIENLCVGQVVKNYRVLCEILGQEPKTSNSKKAQFKEWECYFRYHKEGQKIIIDEIYNSPLNKKDGRTESNKLRFTGNNNHAWKEYDNLIIPYDKMNNYGIYKITLNNNIYIGSTKVGFRKRFQEHNQGHEELMEHTYKLLQQGGTFEILHDMTEIEDVDLIRMIEDEYIKYYLLNPDWNVINKKSGAKSYKRTYEKKERLKSIRVKESDLYDAIQLLAKYGLIDEEGVDM